MTGSGNFPPGRALRPEVRLNKEQGEAVKPKMIVHSRLRPAPVDESPERVTHEEARMMLQSVRETHSPAGLHWLRLERLELYRQQQEQSEREVASLQMRLGEALGMVHEADGHNTQSATWGQLIDGAKSNVKALGFAYEHQADLDQEIGNLRDQRDSLRTQLTDANLKAEGLRVDNEELKVEVEQLRRIQSETGDAHAVTLDKLSESERKLGALHERLTWLCDMWRDLPRDGDRARTFGEAAASVRHVLLTPEASTEPAGVEAGKVDDDQRRGFYRKYDVRRLNDPDGKHAECEYFVLDLTHDKFAGPALRSYAVACAEEFPALAADLERRWGKAGCPIAPRQCCTGYGRTFCDCECHGKAADPTPTEPEAPARFRVGQRVRWLAKDVNLVCQIKSLTAITAQVIPLALSGERWQYTAALSNLQPLEETQRHPADPAPPKPGADLEGPPGSRSIPVYLSEDGQTLAFPFGGFTTVRACIYCGVLIAGGQTACVHCVVAEEREGGGKS